MGEIVKSLMDDGAKLGVSSRGMGSLDQKNGANVVRSDFYLATAADIVADPSAPNAFVEGIFEGKEWIWNNGLIQESEVQQIKDNIEENHRTNNASADSLEFARFLQKL
jgi:cation diffusion facilitator CzcD-associated flavoprotein CzcO